MSKKQFDKKSDIGIKDRQSNKMQPQKKYKVILINDDYTPMQFVTALLEQLFRRSSAEATRIILNVHNQGKGIAGVYSREIAETKCTQVKAAGIQHGYPLLAEMEPE